ncbi:MAG: hypothetical protein HJJLKODD_00460 [Phycisphaerae bacterium]|nr:hypothetical protein [Phycisphaerae bacterium]
MQETSSSLIRGLQDFENHQRWFEFNSLYRPMIRKILKNKCLSGEELEDLVQEVYLSMLSTIERFQYDREQGKFRSWLSKITQRAWSAHRRKHQLPAIDPVLAEQSPDTESITLPDANDERLKLCVELARSRFDEKTWLSFYLRVMEECPIEEVEKITGMNRNAIYQAVHRVKNCLREMLTQLA